MPRATNSVASRKRRRKIIKQAKGNFGARKNVYTVAKNTVEKGLLYAYRDRRRKKVNSANFGFRELMQEQDSMECHILNLWENSVKKELS